MEISDILHPERTLCDVNAGSKKASLEIIASLIANDDPTLSQVDIFTSLLAREKLGSTGLGNGIALPHGRSKGSKSTLGAFIRLSSPIDYDAIDGAPVDLMFGLLVPEESTQEHLDILAKLAEKFSNKDILEILRQESSRDIIYKLLVT